MAGETSAELPVRMVTATYQMAHFLPQAVESVLGQGQAGVDYVVIDDGSTDGTEGVLRGYEGRLRWERRANGGAASAIRAGLAGAETGILGWLNADDVLLPGAIAGARRAFERYPDAVAVYAGGRWVDEEMRDLGAYPVAEGADRRLGAECLICQPACFFRAEAYREAGGLDGSLFHSFDYELWMRLAKLGRFVRVEGEWALSRMHRGNKTLGSRDVALRESMDLLKRHYGYVPMSWMYTRRVSEQCGWNEFEEPRQPFRVRAYLGALADGWRENDGQRARFLGEWVAALTRRASPAR